jgi:hypothetical protein
VEKQPDHAAFWIGPQPTPEDLAESYGADRLVWCALFKTDFPLREPTKGIQSPASCRVCYTSDLGALLKEQARGRDVHVTNKDARKTLEAAASGTPRQEEGTGGGHG